MDDYLQRLNSQGFEGLRELLRQRRDADRSVKGSDNYRLFAAACDADAGNQGEALRRLQRLKRVKHQVGQVAQWLKLHSQPKMQLRFAEAALEQSLASNRVLKLGGQAALSLGDQRLLRMFVQRLLSRDPEHGWATKQQQRLDRGAQPSIQRRARKKGPLLRALGLGLLVAIALGSIAFAIFGPQPTAPDFTVATSDGGEFNLYSQEGEPLLIYFMFVDCHACANNWENFQSAIEQAGNPTVIGISISSGDSDQDLEAYKVEHGVAGASNWQFAREQAGVPDDYDVVGTPTYVVISEDLHESHRFSGGFEIAEMVDALKS